MSHLKTKQSGIPVTVTLPLDYHATVERIAAKVGQSKSAVIMHLVASALGKPTVPDLIRNSA